jgi:hypothetical protein
VNGSFSSEPDSNGPCLILQLQDISARRRAEAELHHIAFQPLLNFEWAGRGSIRHVVGVKGGLRPAKRTLDADHMPWTLA